MQYRDFAGKRVLLASLLPDTGHLTPLLQILSELRRSGAQIHVVAPEEAKSLVERFGVAATYLEPVIPANGRLALSNYSRSTDLVRIFFSGPIYTQRYITPLTANGLGQFDRLLDQTLQFRPDLIVADTHLFSVEYRELAYRSGAKLLLNKSKGSHYYCQDESLWLTGNGLSNARFRRVARSLSSATHYKVGKLFCRRSFKETRRLTSYIRTTRNAYRLEEAPQENVFMMAAGTAEIERRYAGDRIKLLSDGTRIFGPIEPEAEWRYNESLKEWLDSADADSVVYVAFGTMVTPSERRLRKLVQVLLAKEFKVLIATSERPRFLDSLSNNPNVVWRSWVPQPAVLSHSSVFGFASHSGATSVQESLWFGKPMLCMPVLWDQLYFAWLAERVGFGVWADSVVRGCLSLESAAAKFAEDPALGSTARRLSQELRQEEGLKNIIFEVHQFLSE